MTLGTLQQADVLAAINAVQINGQPITEAQFGTLLQYAALAMERDSQQAKAALQQATNGIAMLLGPQSF